MSEQAIRIELRAVIYPDDGWWIAHCLELDIVAEGKSPTEAITSLLSLCDYQIDTAIKSGDIQAIFRPAPSDVWGMYAMARDAQMQPPPRPSTSNVTNVATRQLVSCG